MRRYQGGSLQRVHQGGRLVWKAFWYDQEGTRHSKVLGTAAALSKTEAKAALDELVRPVNEHRGASPISFDTFVPLVFAFKRRGWKQSTRESTEDRINRLLVPAFTGVPIATITRDQLQDFLDRSAAEGTAQSIVAHLRWDLNMVFAFACNEGLRPTNPAELLFVPTAHSLERRVLSLDQARDLFAACEVRERVMVKLCGLAGMRPGEAFALKWSDVRGDRLHVSRRVYRRVIDTPKTKKSTRIVALSESIIRDLEEWRQTSPHTLPGDWLFPSENPKNPLSPANVLRKNTSRPSTVEKSYQRSSSRLARVLDSLGLGWVNWQVLRRSSATLMNHLGIDGKIVADQLGHGLNVSQNVYTIAGVARQQDAVNKLDHAVTHRSSN